MGNTSTALRRAGTSPDTMMIEVRLRLDTSHVKRAGMFRMGGTFHNVWNDSSLPSSQLWGIDTQDRGIQRPPWASFSPNNSAEIIPAACPALNSHGIRWPSTLCKFERLNSFSVALVYWLNVSRGVRYGYVFIWHCWFLVQLITSNVTRDYK